MSRYPLAACFKQHVVKSVSSLQPPPEKAHPYHTDPHSVDGTTKYSSSFTTLHPSYVIACHFANLRKCWKVWILRLRSSWSPCRPCTQGCFQHSFSAPRLVVVHQWPPRAIRSDSWGDHVWEFVVKEAVRMLPSKDEHSKGEDVEEVEGTSN